MTLYQQVLIHWDDKAHSVEWVDESFAIQGKRVKDESDETRFGRIDTVYTVRRTLQELERNREARKGLKSIQ